MEPVSAAQKAAAVIFIDWHTACLKIKAVV